MGGCGLPGHCFGAHVQFTEIGIPTKNLNFTCWQESSVGRHALAASAVHHHDGDDGGAHVDGADDEGRAQGPVLRVAEGVEKLRGVEHDRVDTCVTSAASLSSEGMQLAAR